MTNKLSLSTRIRYRFDSLMAAGTVAIILSLAVATFILVAAATAIISLLRIDTGGDSSLVEAFWVSLLRAMDPGTMGADKGWGFRIVALIVTLGGIFIVSILIGLLTTGISQKLEDLRKGRTFVAEQGHTLILGWSTKLFALVSELVVANENQPKSCVVVMASQDKVMMEDEIRARVGRTGKTKIVCRTGNPAHTSDLEIANPLQAKSIIILSPDEEAPDAHVIKAVLALMSRDPNLQTASTVAEFSDSRNARALQTLTLGRVQSVVSSEVIARMTAQVVRQPGLSAVFVELLDFNGVEVYFNRHDSIDDRPFGDAVQMFENCSVIGLRSADGTIRLNPGMDEICKPDDALVVIAEDDVPLVPTVHGHPLAESSSTSQPPHTERPDRVLVVGWSSLGPTFLRFLDNCVVPESIAHIIYDPALVHPEELRFPKLQNIAIESTEADTMEPVKLADVLLSESFDHVVLLCYRRSMNPMEADARTLMTLLQLRQLLENVAGGRNINIVTELLDVNDVELARIANVDDFIVSERLTSLMLAQLAENPELEFVFQDLFHASGSSEISLRRVEEYFDGNGEATWARIVARGVERGESAIGYRKGKEGTDIQLNPPKSEAVRLSPTDQLIVVASSMGPQPSHRYNRSGGVA